MNKTPNQKIIDLLNSVKAELLKEHNKYSEIYKNAKDEATEKKAFDKGNAIVAEHKVVVAYLKKYHALFTSLYTPQYNGNPEIIKQIDNLEKEIWNKYAKGKELTSAPAASTPAPAASKPAPALEKGKKYGVTKVEEEKNKKDKRTAIKCTIGALILAWFSIDALAGLNYGSLFDGSLSTIIYGGASLASGIGAFIVGKIGVNKWKEIDAQSKSR